jgi:hypothetical protein
MKRKLDFAGGVAPVGLGHRDVSGFLLLLVGVAVSG